MAAGFCKGTSGHFSIQFDTLLRIRHNVLMFLAAYTAGNPSLQLWKTTYLDVPRDFSMRRARTVAG